MHYFFLLLAAVLPVAATGGDSCRSQAKEGDHFE